MPLPLLLCYSQGRRQWPRAATDVGKQCRHLSLKFPASRKKNSVRAYAELNKKVLRERKRHTARRVVSTPSVVLTGYPLPPSWPGWGGLPGYPSPAGYPLAGYPPSRVPPWQGTPPRLDLAGYPPRCLPHGILGNVAKHYGIWVPPQVSAPWHSG